jgi:membrane-associated phospholipid phosphatase
MEDAVLIFSGRPLLSSPRSVDQHQGRRSDTFSLAIATAATSLSALAAMTPGVSRFEQLVFRTVNRLPPILELPLATVMQLGSLGAIFSSAGIARLLHRRELAVELLLSGGISYVAAKGAKIIVARERPGLLLTEVLLRGRAQSGRGFPSGHAAVAAALATIAARRLTPAARRAAWASAGTVSLARIYVGAHLPIDVVGGTALGFGIGTAVAAAAARAHTYARGSGVPSWV